MKKERIVILILIALICIITIIETLEIIKSKNYIYHCFTTDNKYVKCKSIKNHFGFITAESFDNTTYIIKQYQKEMIKSEV